MLYIIFRSACISLFMLFMFSTVRADSIQIRFSQLKEFVNSKSPNTQIIHQEFEKVKAQRDAELKWSNPVIAYDREKVDESKEYQITVGKTFALPWAYFNKRSAWNYGVESAESQYEYKVARLLSDLKSDYVRIKLFDDYLSRLGDMQEIVQNTSEIANTKYSEGHLSGVEKHLIQMVLISLQTSHQAAIQDRRRVIDEWQAKMGIVAEDKAVLATDIDYVAVDVNSIDKSIGQIEQNPEYLSYKLMAQSFDKFVSAARSEFLPEIYIYGGYKKVEPDNNGHVFGVSLSIPLFNLNGSEIKRYMAEKKIVEGEIVLLRNQLYSRSKNLVKSILESQLLLEVFSDHVDEDMEVLENLLYSYEEGWISLNDLLNTIQIEVSGFKNYYDHLFNYYSNIFELETIIGKGLITFNE